MTCLGCLHTFVREGYYGGRTEIYTMRGEGLHYFDLNSSYPAAMLEPMPAGEKLEDHGRIDDRLLSGFIGFVECTVSIPSTCYIPPLPFRARSGKLIFPVGTFSGVWSTSELALLESELVKGEIRSVRRVVWYAKKQIFDAFVRDLYELRDRSRADYDEGIATMAKLLLNSAYGKFGMCEERTQVIYLRDGQSPPEGSKPAGGDPDSRVYYQLKHVSPAYVIPQIAAQITTLARVRLWNVMADVIRLGGRLFYADTDSVITDVMLPSSTALGALKDEYPGEELSGEFIQPKVYILTKRTPFDQNKISTRDATAIAADDLFHKVAMKGLPHSIRAEAYKLLRIMQGDVQLVYPRLEKVRSMARRSFKDGPRLVEVRKGIRSKYDKRVKMADGTTIPIGLCEDAAVDQAAE